MSAVILPDEPRQNVIGLDYVKAGTTTLITVRIGNSVAVITPDEAEKASVDLWSGAGHARRTTAMDEKEAALAKRKVAPRRARKGSIPLTE